MEAETVEVYRLVIARGSCRGGCFGYYQGRCVGSVRGIYRLGYETEVCGVSCQRHPRVEVWVEV
jgi:hypothetical protein